MPRAGPSTSADSLLARLSELEAEVARLRGELDRQHELARLGVLAAGLAHEYDNLLTPVNVAVQRATRKPRDQDATARALEVAAGACSRAGALSSLVLDLAHPHPTHHPELSTPILEAARHAGRMLLAAPMTRLVLDVSPDDRFPVPGAALEHVLTNLLSNAARAGATEITVCTDARRLDVLGGSTWNIEGMSSGPSLCIQDNGHGIPAAILPVAVGEFVGSGSGRGLGLFIVRAILQHHACDLAIESEVGRGTRITLFRQDSRRADQNSI